MLIRFEAHFFKKHIFIYKFDLFFGNIHRAPSFFRRQWLRNGGRCIFYRGRHLKSPNLRIRHGQAPIANPNTNNTSITPMHS